MYNIVVVTIIVNNDFIIKSIIGIAIVVIVFYYVGYSIIMFTTSRIVQGRPRQFPSSSWAVIGQLPTNF